MLVKQVKLVNFRNYGESLTVLAPGKTVLIGENAQGKSNFLEAIEMAAGGRSPRAGQDSDLVRWGADHMMVEVTFERSGVEQSVSLSLRQNAGGRRGGRALEKQVSLNGLAQPSPRAVAGRLVTVGFKSEDLYLLRGGPRYRRDWLDSVILRLRPAFQDTLGSYAKVVTQRNKLLKEIAMRHKVTVADQDQLMVWDKQLSRFGARVVKERVRVLAELLPLAEGHQEHISGQRERLGADYLFKARQSDGGDESPDGDSERREDGGVPAAAPVSAGELALADESEVAALLARLLKQQRAEELLRKQTLTGPHRDDVTFSLDGASAVDFASQGQQRSLVLSLKLAELDLITANLTEPPVLLLDDVLAELDVLRQGFLMSAVKPETQTIITTTHLSRFEPAWLAGARVLSVRRGQIEEFALPEAGSPA